MRAVVVERFGGPEVLHVVQRPVPEPGPGQVLVRVRAAAVNHGETKIRRGLVPELGSPPLPLGSDLSGTVVATGTGAERFAVGDEVFGIFHIGTYADYVAAPETNLEIKPSTLDHVHAAALPVAAQTAFTAIDDLAAVRPGQRVLVHAAAGGVGHLAVQLAALRGAHVLATARSRNHRFLQDLGVDEPIDHTRVDFTRAARNVDVVVDLVGGGYGLRSLDCLRPGGLLLGAALDPGVTTEDAARRGLRYRWIGAPTTRRPLIVVQGLVDAGRLHVHVERTYALEDLPAAHARSDSGRVTGKLVITL
jgi:NADPH:quinone reductase-like Zn-dependent oxidoreductase